MAPSAQSTLYQYRSLHPEIMMRVEHQVKASFSRTHSQHQYEFPLKYEMALKTVLYNPGDDVGTIVSAVLVNMSTALGYNVSDSRRYSSDSQVLGPIELGSPGGGSSHSLPSTADGYPGARNGNTPFPTYPTPQHGSLAWKSEYDTRVREWRRDLNTSTPEGLSSTLSGGWGVPPAPEGASSSPVYRQQHPQENPVPSPHSMVPGMPPYYISGQPQPPYYNGSQHPPYYNGNQQSQYYNSGQQ